VATSRIADHVGRVLSGRYRLTAPIGSGASAHVFVADDVRLRRRVAVKILHPGLADDESFLRRFRAEAQAVAALRHHNIMSVYDWGEDDGDGTPYLVLELLEGGSLRSMLDRGHTLTPAQAARVGLDAARALDHAHRRGLVHRDIKPANLLFDDEGRLCIADFGLARALAEAAWTEPAGAVVGTARYASPEQVSGRSLDGRADVYSLCLVLVEAVTGRVPFTADTTLATLMARVDRAIPADEALGPLAAVIEAGGVADPEQRADAAALVRSLEEAARALPAATPLPLAGSIEPDADLDLRDLTELPKSGSGSRLYDREADAVDVPVIVPGKKAKDEPEPDYLPPSADRKRRRRWPWFVLVALLAAAAAVGGAYGLSRATAPMEPVPDVVGSTQAQATQLIHAAQLHVRILSTPYQDNTTAGQVLDQVPKPPKKLKKDGSVGLVVSKGPTLVAVPDLTNMPGDKAQGAITAAGLAVGNIDKPFNNTVPAGTVLSWSGQGKQLPKGTKIDLVISNGPEPVPVPDGLVNQTYDNAANAIKAAGLNPVRDDEFNDTVTAGNVVSTSPAAQQPVPKGGNVKVTVSKGPDLVAVPNVSGMSVQQAQSTMQQAGLSVANVFGPPDKKVFTTDPPAGSQVKRGSSVNLYTK
jgi:eukaryotic-like serine/threonine-protein kinase